MKLSIFAAVVCFLVAIHSVLFAAQSSSQSSTRPAADVSGTVLDSTRAALPGATVRLLGPSGVTVASTLTDQQGRFRFRDISGENFVAEASLAGFATTSAQATAGSANEIVLRIAPVRENVVVTATRTEAPTSQIAASTTVLDQSEIVGRQALAFSEILRMIPGAAVSRNGGFGTVTTLFVRGGESRFNKVLLDGIPLNEPGGFFDFSNLMPQNLDRIEVVRGPQSALFGTDAMTSVVQLFTARGEPRRPHVSISGEGGKNGTWRSQLALSGAQGPLDYSFDWARLATQNQTPNNAFDNTTATANFGLALGKDTQMRAILRGDLGRTGTPGQTAFGPPDRDAFIHRGDGDTGIAIRNQTTNNWDQKFAYTFSQSRYVSRNLPGDLDYTPRFEGRSAPFAFSDFPFDSLNNTRRHHVSYQSDIEGGSAANALGRHAITFAFDWDRELGAIGDRVSGDPLINAIRDNFGFTFQDQANWRRIFLTNGMRVEDNGSFGVSVVPRSSLGYFVREGGDTIGSTKLKFNFGLSINEPNFTASFSTSPFFLGNPNLAPERVRSFDFGVEQRAFHDRAKLELNWFDNRFRDQIAFASAPLPSNPYAGSFFNLGRSKAKGAEVIAEVSPGEGLRIDGAYTYLETQITQSSDPFSDVFQTGRPLIRRPRHSGTLRVMWNWRRLNITSSTIFVGRRADSDFSSLLPPITSNPGYTQWDVAWSYRSSYRITYFGAAENILNRAYMDVLGYPALKFTARAGIRVSF